jgi:hypothetical protein
VFAPFTVLVGHEVSGEAALVDHGVVAFAQQGA